MPGDEAAPGRLTPRVVFLTLGVAFGFAFLVITPPFQVADEYQHFFHAFGVSEGQLRAARSRDHPGDFEIGAVLPASLLELAERVDPRGMVIPFHPENKQRVGDVLAQFGRPLDPGRRRFTSYFATSRNSPVPYWPQAAGILAGRALNLSPLGLLYAGRFANLLVWLALVSLAITITPLHRWVFVLLALTPMSLSEAASVSPDAFVNALSFVTIALWLHLAFGRSGLVGWWAIAGMAGLTALLAQSKQVYVLLAGLYLLVPARKFPTRGRQVLGGLAVVAAGLLSLGLWAWLFRDLYFPARYDRSVVFAPAEQVRFILEQPWRYLEICWTTVRGDVWSWTRMFIGVLGWLDTVLPNVVYGSYVVVLLVVSLLDGSGPVRLGIADRVVLVGLFVLSVLALMTSLYVVWNALRFPVVQGVQGRYFIPFAPLLFLPFHNGRLGVRAARFLGAGVGVYLAGVLSVAAVALVNRYYAG